MNQPITFAIGNFLFLLTSRKKSTLYLQGWCLECSLHLDVIGQLCRLSQIHQITPWYSKHLLM